MPAVIPAGGVRPRPRVGRGRCRDCGTNTVFLVCALLTVMVLTVSITRTWHDGTKFIKTQAFIGGAKTTSVAYGAYEGYSRRRDAVRTRGYRPTSPHAIP
jgi:hypothetical protein